MPWKETDVMDQRIRFVVQAIGAGANISELCKDYGVSRPTGYLWIKRFIEAGSFTDLGERSRRPHRSPTRTPVKYEDRVVALRKRYGWGARKLRVLLLREGLDLSVATINRIIERKGLLRADQRHAPATRRFERERPNDLWQMDFKGEYPMAKGWCYPLSILDDHSRFVVGLYGLPHQKGHAVHKCLVETFQRYGVPQAMLVDHGVPWWSTTNGHGLTWLSVSLIKQGIRLYLSGIKHPQTQGKVERFHRTLKHSVKHKGKPETLAQWDGLIREIRHEYNHIRPHEALGMHVPASRYRRSSRAYNPKPPEWEYPEGSLVKRLNTQGCLYFNQKQYFICEALAGERVRLEEVEDHLLVSYRYMFIREINLNLGRTKALVLPNQIL